MKLESWIGSMEFWCGIYMALGSLTTTTSFCGVVLPSFLSKPNVCCNGHYLLHFGAFLYSVMALFVYCFQNWFSVFWNLFVPLAHLKVCFLNTWIEHFKKTKRRGWENISQLFVFWFLNHFFSCFRKLFSKLDRFWIRNWLVSNVELF